MSNRNLKVFLLFCLFGYTFADYLSLDGNEWIANNYNKSIKAKATVPGSIYSDLRKEKIVAQNLYFGDNDERYRWVSYDNWTFERTFNVDSKLLTKQSVHLVGYGIDTVSNVYINDKLIGKTENMFIRYKFDVKSVLKSGENTIRFAFESPVLYAKRQSKSYSDKYGYSVPPDCSFPHGECHFNFIRKMASSFSWDWGPAFPTVGIWKSIGIEAYDSAIIRDITVGTIPDQNYTNWVLNVSTHIECASNKEINAIFTIQLDEYTLIENFKQVLKPISNDSTVSLKFIIPINKIKITAWYPNGVADNTQKLYQLKVSLAFNETKEVSTQTKKIGFRTIELIQTPLNNPPNALTFYFAVNGIPFFAKGSNWIPANALYEDITRDYLRYLMISTKEANMNMIRVWGGGIYESDYLYELADEMGVMIWQDFMFACSLYPTNPEFLASVDVEVLNQVRRLQHHPSIAIWAGNNENEVGLTGWWGGDPQILQPDYRTLYVTHIKTIVSREDSSRPYVSSSPSNGLETIKENYTASNPQDNRYGDVHYYQYSPPLWQQDVFPSAKFCSEYGIQSLPSLQTLSQAFDEKDLVFPVSSAILWHQHHGSDDSEMESEISYYLKLPSNGGKERLNDLIYLSQINQAMGIKTETEFYRRNRAVSENGEGFTMGALYWQLNDIWEAPTWASLEFGGKWKVLHSYAVHFFNNQLITVYKERDNSLKMSFIRDDYLGELTFELLIKVFKWSSLVPVKQIASQVKSNSFSANVVYNHSMADLLKESNCADINECVLSVDITNSEHKLESHNFFLFSEPKNSKIVKPNLKLVDVKKGSNVQNWKQVFDIELSAEAIAPFVVLDFKLNSGISGVFPENGFFVFANRKTVKFVTNSDTTVQQIKDNLTVKTLTDVI